MGVTNSTWITAEVFCLIKLHTIYQQSGFDEPYVFLSDIELSA